MKLAWVPYNPNEDIDDQDFVDDLPQDRRASRRSLAPFTAASVVGRMSSPELDASGSFSCHLSVIRWGEKRSAGSRGGTIGCS